MVLRGAEKCGILLLPTWLDSLRQKINFIMLNGEKDQRSLDFFDVWVYSWVIIWLQFVKYYQKSLQKTKYFRPRDYTIEFKVIKPIPFGLHLHVFYKNSVFKNSVLKSPKFEGEIFLTYSCIFRFDLYTNMKNNGNES